MALTSAESAYARLNGIICVYKPQNASMKYIVNRLKANLCRDLNNLETRPPQNYVAVNRTKSHITVNVRPSYADNVLCVGPRYQPEDINVTYPSVLNNFMSGVVVVGINAGHRISAALRNLSLTKCFHVKGILGQASEDFFSHSRIIARAKYEKITQYHIDRVLASYQSYNQRKLFEQYGVNMKSEKAYELAVSGLFRPQIKSAIVMYSIKCIKFNPPDFTLEVQCINETQDYLKELIHNLGVSTKAYATCSGMRCVRQGCFNVEHSLLYKHWNLDNILDNMEVCYDLLENKIPTTVEQLSVVGVSKNTENEKKGLYEDPYGDQFQDLSKEQL